MGAGVEKWGPGLCISSNRLPGLAGAAGPRVLLLGSSGGSKHPVVLELSQASESPQGFVKIEFLLHSRPRGRPGRVFSHKLPGHNAALGPCNLKTTVQNPRPLWGN